MTKESTYISGITREARLFAIKELIRRAGVPLDVFRSWTINIENDWTTIHIQPGTNKRIRFRNASSSFWRGLSTGVLRVARAAWTNAPEWSIRKVVPDFVVPFASEEREPGVPLFQKVHSDCIDCSLDLPLSVLFSLSRVEETLAGDRDVHGRF